jgi:hypothetical protein
MGTVPAVRSVPIPLDRMEVTVHTEFGQYGTQSTDVEGRYKVQKVSLNGNEESSLKK